MLLYNILLFVITTLFVSVTSIPTIEVMGSKFFTSDGKQFFMKGVAYQLTEDDPLIDTNQCQLDAALMAQLGANTIRVYHVNATGDHSGCMNAFAEKGIYLFVDLDSFKTYIRMNDVASWTVDQSDSFRAVMDNFQQYDNTAGFFVGNEVLNTLADSGAAPYLLAAAADLKMYAKAKGYRQIPIGYSATDTAVLRPMLQDYVVCRPNATERLDFYGLNSYEWCGASTYQESGYSVLQAGAEGYPVPIFFTEDGCNTVPPRTFDDQAAIFSSPMVNTWSGAIIYEWIQEVNDYGLVEYGSPAGTSVQSGSSIIDGYTRQGTPTPISPDFDNLKSQWATLTPSGVALSAYSATVTTTPRTCPSFTSGGWTVNPNAALPTMGSAALSGMSSGLPSGIPSGSITVTANATQPPDSSASNLPHTGHTLSSTQGQSSSTATASSTSASASNGAGKSITNPISIQIDERGIFQMGATLAIVCLAAVILL